MTTKIKVKTPLVEMDGDEMTRIIWQMIKDKLILNHLDIELKYYDLGVKHRDDTDDKVTVDAAEAIKQYGVGVKCATITPDHERIEEYKLKKAWPSPNGTIRGILDGTVFRKPIMTKNILPAVRSWKKPITIGRHAYGDLYKNCEMLVDGPGKAELVFTKANGETIRKEIYDFKGGGILMGIHNTDKSIRSFAQACINYAASEKIDLWFGAKDTISKTYHARFKNVFNDEIDKHKDKLEYEAAHGTVRRHYYEHLKGNQTSTNSVASIFAWTGGLKKRGELDGTPEVARFGELLERSVIDCIESGIITKDLCKLVNPESTRYETTEGFIDQVAKRLDKALNS